MADAAAEYLPPWGSAVVALGAMSAFLTSINGSVLVPSRMFFVFSEDRLMPDFLSAVHPKWRTPHISLIISAIICSGLIWTQSALAVGSLLFFLGRRQGSAEGFDYEARMARDMTLEA